MSLLLSSCLCLCAVRAVSLELVRSSRKESQCAAMIVYFVLRVKSATQQVYISHTIQ